jgi:hypothetical protein
MSKMPALRLTTLLAACLLLLAGPVLAASPLLHIKNLKQPLAAGSATTYADLLKLVFPAKGDEAEERQSAPVRQIDDYFEPHPLAGEPDLGNVSALTLKTQNQPLLLLRFFVSGKYVSESEPGHYDLLALFQTAPAPKLLDLLDIKGWPNQFSGFWSDNPVIKLTPATQACLIYQEHFNSSQGYLQIHLFWVRHQRLEDLLSVSPFGNKSLCETFATQTVFWTEPDKGREFPRVVARLTVKMEPGPVYEQCQPRRRGFTRSYRGTWRWDPARQKYHQVSGDLDQLYKWYDQYY